MTTSESVQPREGAAHAKRRLRKIGKVLMIIAAVIVFVDAISSFIGGIVEGYNEARMERVAETQL